MHIDNQLLSNKSAMHRWRGILASYFIAYSAIALLVDTQANGQVPGLGSWQDGLLQFGDPLLEGSGSGVDNGTGIVESYFALALQEMEARLEQTLKADVRLTPKDRQLLSKMLASLPQELAQRPLLVFKPGGADFVIDGLPRIAYTKTYVGAPIYVNQLDLYEEADSVRLPMLSYALVTQILVHEFGHHQGELDHAYLDELGARVATATKSSNDPMIRNGGFEMSSTGNWPTYWWMNPTYSTVAIADSSSPARGNSALRLRTGHELGYGYIFQCDAIKPGQGSVLKISLLARPWFVSQGHAAPFVQIYDDQGQLETFSNSTNVWTFGTRSWRDARIYGQSTWQFRQFHYQLTGKSQSFCLGFGIFGAGTVWIDDILVER